MHKHELIKNQEYCRLNNVDSVAATRGLKGLVESKQVEMSGTKRWAVYRLAVTQRVAQQTSLHFDKLNLNPRQVLALQWIEEKGFITTKQYELLSKPPVSDKTAQKDLNDLEEKELIKRIG